jgi:short-subunit dehydrogenase involved in D-alanine esterification of teichoic acids
MSRTETSMRGITGKTTFITTGASGIGLEMAKVFA